MSTTNTLDGMTTAQLQDLLARTQATFAVKEKAEEAAADAKLLKFGAVGEVVSNDTHAGVRTSTHFFAVRKVDGVLRYDQAYSPPFGNRVDHISCEFSAWWFKGSRDVINTTENRAAVMQLLATAKVWENTRK